ncbi:MAG: RNase adapter RapZ, partial [Lachnospiraceae bacterium]|nr:RNase adapter RapZ [Lachnospiraceae bacterium]
FCVDNLPIDLIAKFAEISTKKDDKVQQVALGIDVRSGEDIEMMPEVLELLKSKGIDYEILFLECSDSVLIKRFKETRRKHPLAEGGRIKDGIVNEREKMGYLKNHADYIIDTSRLLVRELKKEVDGIFVENRSFGNFMLTIMSFGFKYGIPADADLVFDVRFMPNPYYVDELKAKTGLDEDVRKFCMDAEESRTFLDKLTDMIEYLLPYYMAEGKSQLIIAVGCTGGRHRSVATAAALYERLSNDRGGVRIEHRDIMRTE